MRKTDYGVGPAVMPLDRESWFAQLDRSNFINSYYQYRDAQVCKGKRLLIVGPGQGLDTAIFRWKGYEVTTFDIDGTFRPDVQGSVHEMGFFADRQFDLVIASHVLEHLPVVFLDRALHELARVAPYAVIYLPVAGRHGQLRLTLGVRRIGFEVRWDIFNPFARPDGRSLRYCEGQHYWEVGRPGFRVRELKRRFEQHFTVISCYRNRDWLPSFNFVLAAK
jgi:SAM-dependent methyltransferase